jgi:hypothetical protein
MIDNKRGSHVGFSNRLWFDRMGGRELFCWNDHRLVAAPAVLVQSRVLRGKSAYSIRLTWLACEELFSSLVRFGTHQLAGCCTVSESARINERCMICFRQGWWWSSWNIASATSETPVHSECHVLTWSCLVSDASRADQANPGLQKVSWAVTSEQAHPRALCKPVRWKQTGSWTARLAHFRCSCRRTKLELPHLDLILSCLV